MPTPDSVSLWRAIALRISAPLRSCASSIVAPERWSASSSRPIRAVYRSKMIAGVLGVRRRRRAGGIVLGLLAQAHEPGAHLREGRAVVAGRVTTDVAQQRAEVTEGDVGAGRDLRRVLGVLHRDEVLRADGPQRLEVALVLERVQHTGRTGRRGRGTRLQLDLRGGLYAACTWSAAKLANAASGTASVAANFVLIVSFRFTSDPSPRAHMVVVGPSGTAHGLGCRLGQAPSLSLMSPSGEQKLAVRSVRTAANRGASGTNAGPGVSGRGDGGTSNVRQRREDRP